MAKRDKAIRTRKTERHDAIKDLSDREGPILAHDSDPGAVGGGLRVNAESKHRKRFGVELTYQFIEFMRKPSVWTKWYETKRARDEALKTRSGMLNRGNCALSKRAIER